MEWEKRGGGGMRGWSGEGGGEAWVGGGDKRVIGKSEEVRRGGVGRR